MKVATFGLMALSMASANTSFVDEVDSFALADEWEDVPARQLQPSWVDDEGEDQMGDDGDDDQDSGSRRGRNRGRGRQNGRQKKWRRNKGRKGRKGRKGKGKKFDLAKYQERTTKKLQKMEEKMPKKCEKKPKKLAKVCKFFAKQSDKSDWTDADCDAFAAAKAEECALKIPCKLGTMKKKFECEGDFKAMMASIRQEDAPAPSGISAQSVGKCFEDLISDAQVCSDDVKDKIAEVFEGVK